MINYNWSKEIPTEPGYYWTRYICKYKSNEDFVYGPPEIIRIYINKGIYVYTQNNIECVYGFQSDVDPRYRSKEDNNNDYNEYAGPIQLPAPPLFTCDNCESNLQINFIKTCVECSSVLCLKCFIGHTPASSLLEERAGARIRMIKQCKQVINRKG